MSSSIDFEAKSVETALLQASKELNIPREELRYDIISHGSSGIFGLVGAKKALIRVKVPDGKSPVPPPEKTAVEDEGGTGKGQSEPESMMDAAALVDEAFGPIETPEPESAPKPAVDYDEAVAFINPLLQHVIRLVSPDSVITVQTDQEAAAGRRILIEGGDSARLIGKRGQTLDAIQYLVDKIINKNFGPDAQVDIDIEGYLEKRKSELTALASRLAKKAQQTGKPMIINRINAHDRRVIHLTLKENRKVRTQSVGDGDLRKLLILPKKKAAAKKDKNKT